MNTKLLPTPAPRADAALREYSSGEDRPHLLRPVYSGNTAHKYEFCWCEKDAQHLKNEVGVVGG